jgi:hypothetical protein
MSIYDVNFYQTGLELSPTFRRSDEFKGILASLNEPLNDLNLIFKWYREGSTAPVFNVLTVYGYGDVISYGKTIYLKNEVTDGYVAGILPTDTTYFTKILDYFIGVDERIMYNSQKLVFEYALNRFFGTTFRQPPLVSDIYITRDFSDLFNFWVSENDIDTSLVGDTDTDTVYVDEDETTRDIFDFKIKIPVAVFNALGSNATNRENAVRIFANKINSAGYLYIVETY